eukprot:4267932-Alexandrium_andersonii.AAC.1
MTGATVRARARLCLNARARHRPAPRYVRSRAPARNVHDSRSMVQSGKACGAIRVLPDGRRVVEECLLVHGLGASVAVSRIGQTAAQPLNRFQ